MPFSCSKPPGLRPDSLSQDPSNTCQIQARVTELRTCQTDQLTHTFTYTLYVPQWSGITFEPRTELLRRQRLILRSPPTPELFHTPQGTQQNLINNTKEHKQTDPQTSPRPQRDNPSRNPGTTLRSDLTITARPDLNNINQY